MTKTFKKLFASFVLVSVLAIGLLGFSSDVRAEYKMTFYFLVVDFTFSI